jgi:FkbM family methyltransferase
MEQFFKDVAYCWPEHNFKTIFDVGANKGDFSLFAEKYFPESKCYAFEPSTIVYEKLIKNTEEKENIICNKLAVNNVSGVFPFTKDFNIYNSLILPKQTDIENKDEDKLDVRMRALSGEEIELEEVETTTVDSFCSKNNIDKIDILKIDTEGFDLNVIQGSAQMMASESIDIIYSELSFTKDINKFSSFFDVIYLLWLYNYEVFRMYDQASVDGKLRRANVVFTSKNLRENSTKSLWQ